MKRKKHEAHVRDKILKTARRLLIEQGYENTTIRQITKECGVQIGTVYHFFKNKEDIFKDIAQVLIDRVISKVGETVRENDNCLVFANEIRLHLNIIFNNPKSRELYLVAYNSPLIAEIILKKTVARNKELLQQFTQSFTEEDYNVRATFISGCLHGMAIQMQKDNSINQDSITKKIIKLMLQGFNVPPSEINKTLEKL